jgi:hypothetical protein
MGSEHADTVRTRKVLAQARHRLKQPEPPAARDVHGREHRAGVEQPHAGYPAGHGRRDSPDELLVDALSGSRLDMR